jgi:hypothetical protein
MLRLCLLLEVVVIVLLISERIFLTSPQESAPIAEAITFVGDVSNPLCVAPDLEKGQWFVYTGEYSVYMLRKWHGYAEGTDTSFRPGNVFIFEGSVACRGNHIYGLVSSANREALPNQGWFWLAHHEEGVVEWVFEPVAP